MSIARRVVYAVFDDCAGCKHRELIDELRKMVLHVKRETGVMLSLMIVQPGNSRYWTLRKAHSQAKAPYFVFDGRTPLWQGPRDATETVSVSQQKLRR